MRHFIALSLLTLASLLPATAAEPRPFFAFDNGLNAVPTLQGKAELLAELGYDGIAWRPGKTAEMLVELDKLGLKMFSTYVTLTATATDCPIPATIISEIHALKGRDTVVWLNVGGKSDDVIVVDAIRKIADIASQNGLKVALYPHVNCYTDTSSTVLRLVKLAEKPNLGVGFNLCHFLKQSDPATLEQTLRAAAPHLLAVSINGADTGDTRKMQFDRLIQPLGEGSFDNRNLLRLLDQIGYHGTIGLQCYNIKAPSPDHLTKSMSSWRALNPN